MKITINKETETLIINDKKTNIIQICSLLNNELFFTQNKDGDLSYFDLRDKNMNIIIEKISLGFGDEDDFNTSIYEDYFISTSRINNNVIFNRFNIKTKELKTIKLPKFKSGSFCKEKGIFVFKNINEEYNNFIIDIKKMTTNKKNASSE